MGQYIEKSALVAEINQRIEDYKSHKIDDSYHDGLIFALEDLRDDFLDTIEVKDANEALRTEYEKGRADVIAKTLEWINAFNDNNYIMQYSDSCEHPINEIIEWYKNYINRE